MGRKSYIFTNKKHPLRGIMSTIMGVIALASQLLAIFLTYRSKGEARYNYGTVALLALLLSVAGMTMGILSRMEKDKFYLFSYLGIFFNFLTLAGTSLILYAGAYGL